LFDISSNQDEESDGLDHVGRKPRDTWCEVVQFRYLNRNIPWWGKSISRGEGGKRTFERAKIYL